MCNAAEEHAPSARGNRNNSKNGLDCVLSGTRITCHHVISSGVADCGKRDYLMTTQGMRDVS